MAGPSESNPRPVSSAQPPTSGRNKYTAEDDRLLYDWVTKAVAKGASEAGNELYKELWDKVSQDKLLLYQS